MNALLRPLLLSSTLLTSLFYSPSHSAATHDLDLEGTHNTRDLGGLMTQDGLVIQKGLLYRSDSLHNLTATDLEAVRGWGLAGVTDFRTEAERAAAPNPLSRLNRPQYRALDVNNPALDITELRQQIFSGALTDSELQALLGRENNVLDPRLRQTWGHWLRSLTDEPALPHLYHCTAGKDRTGVATALILMMLGVPEGRIMQDFLASNERLALQIESNLEQITQHNPRANETTLRQILGVDASSLTSLFDTIQSEYGSVDGFLTKGLGIDSETRQRFKAQVLADPREAGRPLSAEEILARFSDVEDHAQLAKPPGTTATNQWRADGSFTNVWSMPDASGTVTGTWTVDGDQRCVSIKTGREDIKGTRRCGPIHVFEDHYYTLEPDGELHAQHRVTPLPRTRASSIPEAHP